VHWQLISSLDSPKCLAGQLRCAAFKRLTSQSRIWPRLLCGPVGAQRAPRGIGGAGKQGASEHTEVAGLRASIFFAQMRINVWFV
jgi:hypothetical protein